MLQMKKWKGVIIDEGMERGESQQQKYWPQIIRKSIKDPKVTLGDEICYGVYKSFDVALARADALLMLTENPTNRGLLLVVISTHTTLAKFRNAYYFWWFKNNNKCRFL